MLSYVDTTLLWMNIGISLLVLVFPPSSTLSLKKALTATLVERADWSSMLALAALSARTDAYRRWCSSGLR